MTEALVSKTCTPCRGGVPPLTREQAELFHAQAPGLATIGGSSPHLRSVAQRTKAALSGNHRPRERQRLLQQNLPIAVISPEMRLNRPIASMLKS